MKTPLNLFACLIITLFTLNASASPMHFCIPNSKQGARPVSLCISPANKIFWARSMFSYEQMRFTLKKIETKSCGPTYDDQYCDQFKITLINDNKFTLITGKIVSTSTSVVVSVESDSLGESAFAGDLEIGSDQARAFSELLMKGSR